MVLLAWGRVVVTPGEIFQGDLTYALHADLLPRAFFPAWDPNRHSVLISVGLLGTHGPFVIAGMLFGLSSAVVMKSLVVGWALLGYAMAWAGFRLFLGPPSNNRGGTAAESLGLAVGSMFWVLNPWYLARLEQLGVALSALGLPLALGLMEYSIRSGRRLPVAGCALATVLISMASPHYLATTVSLLGLLWVVRFVRQPVKRANMLKIGITYLLVLVGAGAFVWLPAIATLATGGQLQPTYVSEPGPVIVSTHTQTLWNTVTLTAHHFFGVTFRPVGLASAAWSVASLFGVASLGLAIVFDSRRRAMWIFVGAVAGAFLMLLSLSSLPSGAEAYEFIVRSVPFGWLIREPDKLGAPIAFGYALGMAWIVPAAIGLPFRRDWAFKRGASALAVVVIAGVMTVWIRPSIERSLIRTDTVSYVPVEFPLEYYEFTDTFVPLSDPNSAVLIFNQPNRSPFWSQFHIVRGALHGSMRGRRLSDSLSLSPIDRLGKSALADPKRFSDVLLAAGVGAVALAVDDQDGRELAETIASFPGVSERPDGQLIRGFDLIGTPAPLVDIGGLEPQWRRPTPTRYEVDVPGSRESGRLVLRELADSHWRATLNGNPLERSADPLFNAWDLPSSASGVVELNYELQTYLVVGYLVAGITLIAVFAAAIPLGRIVRGRET